MQKRSLICFSIVLLLACESIGGPKSRGGRRAAETTAEGHERGRPVAAIAPFGDLSVPQGDVITAASAVAASSSSSAAAASSSSESAYEYAVPPPPRLPPQLPLRGGRLSTSPDVRDEQGDEMLTFLQFAKVFAAAQSGQALSPDEQSLLDGVMGGMSEHAMILGDEARTVLAEMGIDEMMGASVASSAVAAASSSDAAPTSRFISYHEKALQDMMGISDQKNFSHRSLLIDFAKVFSAWAAARQYRPFGRGMPNPFFEIRSGVRFSADSLREWLFHVKRTLGDKVPEARRDQEFIFDSTERATLAELFTEVSSFFRDKDAPLCGALPRRYGDSQEGVRLSLYAPNWYHILFFHHVGEGIDSNKDMLAFRESLIRMELVALRAEHLHYIVSSVDDYEKRLHPFISLLRRAGGEFLSQSKSAFSRIMLLMREEFRHLALFGEAIQLEQSMRAYLNRCMGQFDTLATQDVREINQLPSLTTALYSFMVRDFGAYVGEVASLNMEMLLSSDAPSVFSNTAHLLPLSRLFEPLLGAQQKHAALVDSVLTLQQQLAPLREEIRTLKEALARKDSEVSRALEAAGLTQSSTQKRGKGSGAAASSSTQQSGDKQLKESLKEVRRNLIEAEKQLRELRAKNDALEQARTGLNTRVSSLQKSLDEERRAVSHLKKQLSEAESTQRKTIETLEEVRRELEAKIGREKLFDKTFSDMARERDQAAADLQREKERFQTALSTVGSTHEELRRGLQQKLDAAEKALAEARAALERNRAQPKAYRDDEVADLSGKNAQLRSHVAQLESRVRELEAEASAQVQSEELLYLRQAFASANSEVQQWRAYYAQQQQYVQQQQAMMMPQPMGFDPQTGAPVYMVPAGMMPVSHGMGPGGYAGSTQGAYPQAHRGGRSFRDAGDRRGRGLRNDGAAVSSSTSSSGRAVAHAAAPVSDAAASSSSPATKTNAASSDGGAKA